MTFRQGIDKFMADMRMEGRIRSDGSEVGYRATLVAHAEDVDNRDPRTTNRRDVKRTLTRWQHPNTQASRRSMLVSFYRWAMEEGIRKDNPAEQTRRPKRVQTKVYRMALSEAQAFLRSARTTRERRIAFLGVCAGLRNAELRGLQRRHFERAGFVHVSADIAKGERERWVPITAELAPVVAEILATLGSTVQDGRGKWVGEYVLPAQRWSDPPLNTTKRENRMEPSSSQSLRTIVMRLAERAGIKAHIHPHLMRHAFCDHLARFASLEVAQHAMGHANPETTKGYTGSVTLDELTAAFEGFTFGLGATPSRQGAQTRISGRGESNPHARPDTAQSHISERAAIKLGLRMLDLRAAFRPLAQSGGGFRAA